MGSEPVYIDRDGVINKNRTDYVKSLKEWVPLPRAIEAITMLGNAGHPVIVITNQSAIGRNICSVSNVEEIHRKLIRLVRGNGGEISGIYYCPHHPDENCDCRKPHTGMVDSAKRELKLPDGGYIIGDADSDMELGRRAGLKTILVLTGRGKSQMEKIRTEHLPEPWRIEDNIFSAVETILEDSKV